MLHGHVHGHTVDCICQFFATFNLSKCKSLHGSVPRFLSYKVVRFRVS